MPVEKLLNQTGYNVEEDKPLLEAGKCRNMDSNDTCVQCGIIMCAIIMAYRYICNNLRCRHPIMV